MPLYQFVHIGDLHLGPNSRNADRLRALDQIVSAGLELPGLAGWLWPGDLNHARMTIDDRNALSVRLQAMADRAPVVIVRGNHDLPGDLDIFGRLQATWPIHVVTQPQPVRVLLPVHGREARGDTYATVVCLPYPDKAALVSLGVAPGDVVQTASAALEDLFEWFRTELAAAAAVDDVPIFLGHINVAGAIASSGQPNIGHEIELDAALLAKLGPYYIGLNHIHKAQTIGAARYPGSCAPLDWGEVEEKEWIEVVYEQDGVIDVRPHRIDVPALYHVEGELTRDGFTWRVMDRPDGTPVAAPPTWGGAEVRVRYRFKASEKRVVDEALARAPFVEASRLELEPVGVPDRGLRAPEVAAARTLAEKVAAWATVTGTVVPASALDKLSRLEHGDAASLLSQLSRELDGQPPGDALAAAIETIRHPAPGVRLVSHGFVTRAEELSFRDLLDSGGLPEAQGGQ